MSPRPRASLDLHASPGLRLDEAVAAGSARADDAAGRSRVADGQGKRPDGAADHLLLDGRRRPAGEDLPPG